MRFVSNRCPTKALLAYKLLDDARVLQLNASKLAVGDFTAQMNHVMESITGVLTASGAGWNRVVKVNIMLTRREDFAEMNRIYTTYFSSGKLPARTTAILSSLPQSDFLPEIECEAILG